MSDLIKLILIKLNDHCVKSLRTAQLFQDLPKFSPAYYTEWLEHVDKCEIQSCFVPGFFFKDHASSCILCLRVSLTLRKVIFSNHKNKSLDQNPGKNLASRVHCSLSCDFVFINSNDNCISVV